MAKIRLNDKSIRHPPPASGQVELWDTLQPGFGLRIAAGGARTYVVMARVDRTLKRRTVGKAPPPNTPAGVALPDGMFWPDQARRRARDMLNQMALGEDPGLKRHRRTAEGEASGAGEGTVKWAADKYLASTLKGGGGRLRTKAELERKLKVDLCEWHDRPIASIRKRDIQALIDTKAETSPIAANRLLSFIKRLFAWAAEKDLIEADPARAVGKPADERTRTRYLDEREIRLFWRACEKLDAAPSEAPDHLGVAGRLFQLCLVTGQRRGEVAGMLRAELGNLEIKRTDPATGKVTTTLADAWMLPGSRMKRGVEHTCPLSPLALKLIEDAPKRAANGKAFDHVLTSGAAGDKPLSGWSKYKSNLDRIIGELIATEADEPYDAERHRIPEWHIHDLRATAATFLESRLEVPTRIVSRILHHAEGDVDRGRSMTSRYVRHTYDAEAAEALNRWAELIERLVGLNIRNLDEARH
ncbi:MAG: hypothetical protein JWQ97_409 [Phenylobacterium sp.]|nr:hypothetical protein [Phenylobacterium sp.]